LLNLSVSQLVQRHRLTLAQIARLGLGKVEGSEFLNEKLRALSQLKLIQKTLDQLDETGIFYVCIKGFTLSQRIYQDPTFRFSKDLDILVPNRKNVILLRDKLMEEGWQPTNKDWVNEQPRLNWLMDNTQDVGLLHPSTGIHLEIHWELDDLFFKLDEENFSKLVLENVEKIQILNRSITVLSPELEVLYLLIHGAKHAWFRLKWLVDIFEYPVEILDQNKFRNFLEGFHCVRLLFQADELLKFYFGKGIGIGFEFQRNESSFLIKYAKIKIASEVSEESPKPIEFANYIFYHFLLAGEKRNAVVFLLKKIGVRPQDICEVKLDHYWKYFFYRYYSLLRRKFF
jgi:hypothetical protein